MNAARKENRITPSRSYSIQYVEFRAYFRAGEWEETEAKRVSSFSGIGGRVVSVLTVFVEDVSCEYR